jgi:ADP-ribosylglycohydrolase
MSSAMEVSVTNESYGPMRDKAIGAMLGVACGDALGWPNERAGHVSAVSHRNQRPLREFQTWTRRSGGRYYPYEETIESGEYSDDTQLTLCVGRSLLRGPDWWEWWTRVELPFWTLYERGGGGATKRAAESWANGCAPWAPRQDVKDISRYFEAGGNGVAMRVLPHVIHGAELPTFGPILRSIFLDGITTHGHPRALVGAQAYGFALWKSLRRRTRLEYGKIAAELLSEMDEWSQMPSTADIDDSWTSAVHEHVPSYRVQWHDAVLEMEDYMRVCDNELSKGALALDDDALHKLQCFDRRINGAGTVAAAASVFLASRYAAEPMNGVVRAAYASGTDTDTIASMTGGLLGTICGSDWLGANRDQIQDSKYLTQTAQEILTRIENPASHRQVPTGTRAYLRAWLDRLLEIPEKGHTEIPGGRYATVTSKTDLTGRSGKYRVQCRKLTSADGQTMYFSKISKEAAKGLGEKSATSAAAQRTVQSNGRGCGAKVPVASLDQSVSFYREFLRLSIKKQSPDTVVFDQGLVLVPLDYLSQLPDGTRFRSLVYVQVPDIEGRYLLAQKMGVEIISPLAPYGKSTMLFFRCLDPDNNVVEVFAPDKGK